MSAYVLDPRPFNDNFRLTALQKRPKLTKGIDAVLSRLFGRLRGNRWVLKGIIAQAQEIAKQSAEHSGLDNNALQRELSSMRIRFRRGGKALAEARKPALALIQEAAFRTVGFRPYCEQIAGALALERGFIAEMSTGEGKTVTIAMAAVLRGWSGFPCHVLTANDYLASRDAQIMGQFFAFCGVTVGSVTSEMDPSARKAAYARDVTYSTAKEVLADFLRDRITLGKRQNYQRRMVQALLRPGDPASPRGVVMRGVHTAIVDEADNVLIDEAVTPLIISRQEPNEPFALACIDASATAQKLHKGVDYALEEEFRTVRLLRDVVDATPDKPQGARRLYAGALFQRDLVRQAVVAKEFFHRDKQYVVEDGKVIIVDESTGRKMPMRTWSAGLHQLIELKEGLEMTPVQETQARLSFQRYFRFYKVFSGMTGTGKEAAGEFWQVYGTPVLAIPNHRPSQRIIHPLQCYAKACDKWNAIVKEIESVHATGRPILIGIRDVQQSELLSARLSAIGLSHKLVNAVRQQEEAQAISVAGQRGAITVATNMAGRGTDIKVPKDVEAIGGLHVIASECHKSSRIDRQLFGRSARQGDRGSAILFTSLEDEIPAQNLPPLILKGLALLRGRHGTIMERAANSAVGMAQTIAQRKDVHSRSSVQEMDTWLDDSLSFSQDDVN